MRETLKKQSGITLIALVITIIVLLILVAVVVATLTGENGILNRASDASSSSKRADLIDRVKLEVLEDRAQNNGATPNLSTILGKYFTSGSVTGADLSDMTTSLTAKDEYGGESIGAITLGEILSNTTATTPGSQDNPGTDPTSDTPSEAYLALREGDTVYIANVGGQDLECTVLYDSQNANYSTYGVQIIPRNPVTTVELGNGTGITSTSTDTTHFATAKASYNDAINILNTAASTYVTNNSSLSAIAQSSRCVGSLPGNPSAQNSAMYSHTEGTNDYFATYDGQFNAGEEDSTYRASNTTNYTVDRVQLRSLNILQLKSGTNIYTYWFASRVVSPGVNQTYFQVHCMRGSVGNAIDDKVVLCSVSENWKSSDGNPCGLRPCITLKSNIKATITDNKTYLSAN